MSTPVYSRLKAADATPVPFYTARRTLPAGDPILFLRSMEGRSRGFWARGGRWVAHSGVLGTLMLENPADEDRYGRVTRAAREWSAVGDGEEALRFYGGFSFREGHSAQGVWEAFPSALFHLPLVEFDGDGAGPARLRVRVPLGDDAETAREQAEAEADRLAAALLTQGSAGRTSRHRDRIPAITVEGERDPWLAAVEETLERIRAGEVSKTVLARTLDVTLEQPVSTVDVLGAIWNQHHSAHAFLFEPEAGQWLLGAAPEILVTLRDGRVFGTAVAGSARRGDDPAEDARLGQSLLESRKDLAEHGAVVDAMVAGFANFAGDVVADDEPHLLQLARIQHLETEVSAAARPGLHVLELVAGLHPTPAVGGVPRVESLELIREIEPFSRGWYAGPVGWFDTEGDGHFVPALRTAVGGGRMWRLFAGAGIVDGSQAALEWEETGLKFTPVLRALVAAGVKLRGVAP